MASTTIGKNIPALMSEVTQFLEELLTGTLKDKYAQKALKALQTDEAQEALTNIIVKNTPQISKTRKTKRKTDPNKPKKNPSAYLLFCKAMREKIKADNPDAKGKDIMVLLGQEWSNTSEKKRKPFADQAVEAKTAYLEDMKSYTPSDEWLALESASDSESGKKTSKKRKTKAGPKRALSAYLYFCQAMRSNVKETNPTFAPKEITSELGRLWREMTDKQKKPYNKLNAKDKARFDEEKANWVDPSSDDQPPEPKKKSTKKSKASADEASADSDSKPASAKKAKAVKKAKVPVADSDSDDDSDVMLDE